MIKYKIAYDPEVNILTLTLKKGKVVDSDVKGNIVLDYGKNGELLSLDIMDVNLEELILPEDKKKLLM